MDSFKLKEVLDRAEQMGFERGAHTIMLDIMKSMESKGETSISAKNLKEIWQGYLKDSEAWKIIQKQNP